MTITNIQTSSAYPGEGVKVTLDKTDVDAMEFLSWAYPGMELTSDASGEKGIINTVDRQGNSFIVAPAQPNLSFMGSEPFKLKPTDTISFNENKIGNLIWRLTDETTTTLLDGSTLVNATSNAIWSNNTSGAYSYYLNDPITYPVPAYNMIAARKKLSTMVNGWRLPTLVDFLDLFKATNPTYTTYLTGSNILPYNGFNLRATTIPTPGINFKNFNAVYTFRRTGNNAQISYQNPEYLCQNVISAQPPWAASIYRNMARTLLIQLQTFSTQASSAFATTGAGIRLCRDYQESVVITK